MMLLGFTGLDMADLVGFFPKAERTLAMAKFYRTTISFDILSEDPIPEGIDVAGIVQEADTGAYVMGALHTNETELTSKECAAALIEFGSEPGFFNLDDEGNSTLDMGDE